MKTNTAMIMFTLGFLLTGFGVGGIENSIETVDLLGALAVATVGLLIMWAGTTAMRVSEYYDTH